MTTDLPDASSNPALTGLFLAGLSLGAVYALNYTRLGTLFASRADPADATEDGRSGARRGAKVNAETGVREVSGRGEDEKHDGVGSTDGVRKRRGRRGKGKGVGGGGGGAGDEAKGGGGGEATEGGDGRTPASDPQVPPGGFGDVPVHADVAAPTGPTSKPGTAAKTQKKKTKQKEKKQQGKEKDAGENKEVGSETGREVVHAPRSEDGTDASVSLSPSVSGDALERSSRGAGKGTPLAPPSQPQPELRGVRSSSSFDTDSSWTHVNRRLKMSKSTGQLRGPADAMDVASSDLTSTASDSPVAERTDNVTVDMREPRADLPPRTLAEKLNPRPRKTGVDDMLEEPDVPTLARVIRVQPRPDDAPVPGFSWDDYGEVIEESVLVHDADEEDEGEWGIVKSRNRTRPLQTNAAALTASSASTSRPPAAPETMNKKQRQNARKRELAKAAKAEAETARLQGLAKHKHELERLRIIEQSRQGGGKQPSGGMQAKVDDRGKLVWE